MPCCREASRGIQGRTTWRASYPDNQSAHRDGGLLVALAGPCNWRGVAAPQLFPVRRSRKEGRPQPVPGRTTGGVLHMLLGGAMLLDLQIREVVVIQEPIHKEHGGTSYPRGRESSQAVRAANGSASDSGARLPMTSVSYSNLSKSSSRKLAETLRDAFSSSHLVLQRPYSYTDVDYLDHCVVRPLLEREQRSSEPLSLESYLRSNVFSPKAIKLVLGSLVAKGLVSEEAVPAQIGGFRIPLLPSGFVYKLTPMQQPPTVISSCVHHDPDRLRQFVASGEENRRQEHVSVLTQLRGGFRSELLDLSWYGAVLLTPSLA
eukprot:scaffold44_cov411-Prasinococcus_capsulatus_cf.AAC.10